MQVTTANGRFNVNVQGQGDPLLLIHGFPLDLSMWNAQVAAFAHSHHTVAVDLRGFGGSEMTQPPKSMNDYANDLIAILDALEISQPVAICGLSMGGYIAFAFAKHHSHRLGRLILCDTQAAADSTEKRADRERLAAVVERNGTAALARDMPIKLLSPQTIAEKPEIVDVVREMIANANPAAVAAASRAMAARENMTNFLPQIAVPTLVLCGEADSITSESVMRSFATRIPNARFQLIPAAGHMAPLENPEATTAAMREFLQ